MKRDWCPILIDAGIRGLSATEAAAEHGIPPRQVREAARQHGLALVKGVPGPRDRKAAGKKAASTRTIKQEAAWQRRFEATPPHLTINDFRRLHGLWGARTADLRHQAALHGYTFAPSPKDRTPQRSS